MTFLQNTGAGTRSWLMGPRDVLTDDAGWMEYDRRDDENGRIAGDVYEEREWSGGVQENGEAGDVAEGAEEDNEAVGVG
jgi:IMP cyclohydrolase